MKNALAKNTLPVRLHFDRTRLARKPFSVSMRIGDAPDHATRTLSQVRTATILALFVELHQRGAEAVTKGGVPSKVQEVFNEILPDAGLVSLESARVAFIRAGQFLEEEFAEALGTGVTLSVEDGKLQLYRSGEAVPAEKVHLEITSSDKRIAAFLDRAMQTTPLLCVRKHGSLFIPPGEDCQDRFVLDLIQGDAEFVQTTLFYRPTVVTVPPALMERMHLSETRRKRRDVLMEALSSRRGEYHEVLQRKALWDFAQRQGSYTRSISASEALDHLRNIMHMVETLPAFELILTDAFFPFYINATARTEGGETEHFVQFFQNGEDDHIRAVGAFAVKDEAAYLVATEQVVRWVLEHPTTTRNREKVLEELREVRDAVAAHGSAAQYDGRAAEQGPSFDPIVVQVVREQGRRQRNSAAQGTSSNTGALIAFRAANTRGFGCAEE